ncbi:HPr family phosphocarrier protein [Micropruina sp.]|uniref:HPr family phosphocarrier protein n=1 Tax=Micropruina sp. TaxID=2737536 RepID=UPI0039E4C985
MLVRSVTVGDRQGLHALVAHALAAAAAGFTASIWVRHDGRRASLTDPVQVLALAARADAVVTVLADGLDEADALDAICAIIEG